MNRLSTVIVGALVSGACGSVSAVAPDAGSTEGPSTDADTNGADAQVVSTDAAIDAAFACAPSTTTCTNNVLTTCGADGAVASTETCGFGCASSGGACADLAPSNGLAAQLDLTTTAPDITFADVAAATTINTDTGDVIHNGVPVTIPSVVQTQSGAPSIRVFRVKSFTSNNEIVVSGSNALALVAGGDVLVANVVRVSAQWKVPGPGAFVGSSACNGGDATVVDPTGSTTRVPGAGGGGLGTAGAAGGTAIKGASGTSFGASAGSVAGSVDLQPLRGGCRGGNVISPQDAYWINEGGGGGGAIQISSRGQITVATTGVIDAGGGGADSGKSGTGGGSGGAILLEAKLVTVDGKLAANGGGGTCFNSAGENGRDHYGGDGLLAAAGGDCVEANGVGDGGIGASKDNAAAVGGNGNHSTSVPIGGGGGGGAGRIRINTKTGSATKGASALVTPFASEAAIVLR